MVTARSNDADNDMIVESPNFPLDLAHFSPVPPIKGEAACPQFLGLLGS
jgi:hypothetical protein